LLIRTKIIIPSLKQQFNVLWALPYSNIRKYVWEAELKKRRPFVQALAFETYIPVLFFEVWL